MVESVAGHGAISGGSAGANELKPAVRRGCDVIAIKVNQACLGLHAVRIVASRASGLLIDNVVAMTTVLSELIGSAEALIAKNTASIMALIAKRVTADAFDRAIRQRQLTFKNGCVNRAMRSIRPGAARLCPLVIVMAIGAINATSSGQRGKQAGHIGILPNRFHRMIRLVGRVKLKPLVSLDDLSVHMRGSASNAVRMASETEFVFRSQRINDSSRRAQPLYTG